VKKGERSELNIYNPFAKLTPVKGAFVLREGDNCVKKGEDKTHRDACS
jgi:hypothetical protein